MRANSCVVIDVGSQCVKAGFADTFPKEQEPHIVRLDTDEFIHLDTFVTVCVLGV